MTSEPVRRRIKGEVQQWAIVVLVVAVAVIGFYVHALIEASDESTAASNRAAAASDRAATAAAKASADLSAAIQASSNTEAAAATRKAIEQIDLITRILCAEHADVCPP